MYATWTSIPAASAILKILFYIFALLVFAAIGYAGWMIAAYWGDVRM